MNFNSIFSDTRMGWLSDEPIKWNGIKTSADDFEIITTFVNDSGIDSNDGNNQFKKNLLKLSLLNHAKRVPIESGVLKNYIFNLISQNLICSDEVKVCMDFILDETFSNKMILELDEIGKIKKYYTDLVGCEDIDMIDQNISDVFVGFSNEVLSELKGRITYSNFEMIPGKIGKVEIQIHVIGTSTNSFILLRY